MPEHPRPAFAEVFSMQSSGSRARLRTRARKHASLVALTLAALGVAPDVRAIVIRHDVPDTSYTGLGNESRYLSAAAIYDSVNHRSGTGVIISPKWVFTAGHVVVPSGLTPGPISVNAGGTTAANGTTYGTIVQTISPYTGNLLAGNDIGLIQLSTPITGITPASRWFGTSETGKIGTSVGYGDTGTGLTGPTVQGNPALNLKRGMHNMLDGLGPTINTTSGPYSSNTIFSDFDDPGNADGYHYGFQTNASAFPNPNFPLEGLIAGGDSGGPVYVDDFNGRNYVGAVHSFVTSLPQNFGNGGMPVTGFPFFIYADVQGSTRVTPHNLWIDNNITNNWKTATNGTFGTAANWSVGTYTSGAPGVGDLAGFNVVGSYTVTLGAAATNHMLLARQGNVTIDLNNFSYTLTSNMYEGAMVIGRYSGNDSTVTLTKGTLHANAGDVILGQINGSTGRLRIGADATMNVAGSLYAGGTFGDMGGGENGGAGIVSIQTNTSALNVSGTVRILNNGTVNYDHGTFTAGKIDISGNGRLLLAVGGDKVLRTNAVTISGSGAIDMSNNDMLITYSANPDSTIRDYIKTGKIFSSAATASLGLGYGDNAILNRSTFDGIPIGSNTELIKYTYFGDADLDGDVDQGDLTRMAQSWQNVGSNWIGGDFNYDGLIDARDLLMMANNWFQGVGAPIGPDFGAALATAGLPQAFFDAVALPEPGAIVSLALTAPFLLRRRRLTNSQGNRI